MLAIEPGPFERAESGVTSEVRPAIGDAVSRLWEYIVDAAQVEPITLFTLLFVLGVRFVEGYFGFFSRQPVRRARRRTVADLSLSSRTVLSRAWWTLRVTTWLLGGHLRRNLRSGPDVDIARIAHKICAPGRNGSGSMPIDGPRFKALVGLCERSIEPGAPGLIVRYLTMGAWEENRALLEQLLRYLQKFEELRPVAVPDPLWRGGATFAEAVSALTGALVVADCTTSAARRAERVAVWHTGQWQGRPSPGVGATGAGSLEKVGNFNGAVSTLIGAEVRQSRGSDGPTLVLVTGESDYLSTEPVSSKPSAMNQIDQAPPACKKLLPTTEDDAMRRFVPLAATTRGQPIGGSFESTTTAVRGALLNVKVGLVSLHQGTPHLVLMRRTRWVSNARGAVSPTAGGVIQLPVAGDARDSDGLGSVDFLRGASRYLATELGLRPEQYNVGVHAVFLSNNRPRPISSEGADLATGELVATVLVAGTTMLGPDDFRDDRAWAPPGIGPFESRGALFVPMGSSADDFANNISRGRYDPESGTWLGTTSTGGESLSDTLEQPTMIAAMYASTLVHEPAPTIEAFRNVASGTPWWAEPWPDAAPGAAARICRDPEALLKPGSRGGFASWAAALKLDRWDGLLTTLQQDARLSTQKMPRPDATRSPARA